METVKEVDDSPRSTNSNNFLSLNPLEEERLRLVLRMQQAAASTCCSTASTSNDGINAPNSSANRKNNNNNSNFNATAPARTNSTSAPASAYVDNNATQPLRRFKSAAVVSSGCSTKRAASFTNAGMPQQRAVGTPNRLPQRSRSGYGGDLRPLAPTKSNDALSSIRGNAVARANSSQRLQRVASSCNNSAIRARIAPPARALSASYSGGLRPYTRDQIVNTQIEQKVNQRIIGPGGTLQRTISGMSVDSSSSMNSSAADFSLYTADSIHVRKTQQVIADPLDDRSYVYGYGQDDCSFADHDTYVTRLSSDDFDVFECSQLTMDHRSEAVLTFDKSDPKIFTERLHRMGITENVDDDQSFCTTNSALTNDFGDFLHDDDDDDDDEVNNNQDEDEDDEFEQFEDLSLKAE